MKFLDIEMCERLIALGCVSHSLFWYYGQELKPTTNEEASGGKAIPAFNLLDFVENEQYAIENCKKLLVWRHRLLEDDWRVTIKKSYDFLLQHRQIVTKYLSQETALG